MSGPAPVAVPIFPPPRAVRNSLLLAACIVAAIYFGLLHLKSVLLASAAVVILATAGAAGKVIGPLKPFLAPVTNVTQWFVLWRFSTPLLAVLLALIIALLLTTASVTLRLTDSANAAKINVAAVEWRQEDVLQLDADRKEATERFWFRTTRSDIRVTPLADVAHAPHTMRCVLPSIAMEMRIPEGLSGRHVICLLPATGVRLPFFNDPAKSRFSGFVLVRGRKYPFGNWKLGALYFGTGDDDLKFDPAVSAALEKSAGVYFTARDVKTSDADREEYLTNWKTHATKVATPQLEPGEVVFIEVDEDGRPYLRQLITVDSEAVKNLYVERLNEPEIVDEWGK